MTAHIIYFPIICRGCDRPIHHGLYCWQCQEWIDREPDPQPSLAGSFLSIGVAFSLIVATAVYVGSLLVIP